MSTTLTNGLKLPDKGSVDWYADMQSNYAILDGAVGTIAEHTSALAGKANAVHTHTKADITDLFNSANTWGGTNSFSIGNLEVQTEYTLGTLPQAESAVALFTGRTIDNNFVTNINFYQSPTRGTGLRFTIRNKWDNNGYSTTGTTRNAHFELLQSINKTAYMQWEGYVNNGLYPLANNTYDLGSNSYQWNNLYAKNYYYNGTAWGLDKANTWTNFNRVPGYRLQIKSSAQEIGVIPTGSNQWNGFQFVDKNNTSTFSVQQAFITSGETRCSMTLINNSKSSDSDVNIEYLRFSNNLDNSFAGFGADTVPLANNTYNLGNSSNKWKTLWTNGINSVPTNTVEWHNSHYRGINLISTGHFANMAALLTAIRNQDWSDIYIGDYVELTFTYEGASRTVKFYVGEIDKFYKVGDASLNTHHLVMVTGDLGINQVMNDSNTTAGGYVGSKAHTVTLPALYAILNPLFNNAILTHKEHLSSIVTSSQTVSLSLDGVTYSCNNFPVYSSGSPNTLGCVTAGNWYDCNLVLMSEIEMFGSNRFASSGIDDVICPEGQIAAFKYNRNLQTLNRTINTWLRNVNSAALFCICGIYGSSYRYDATRSTIRLRPRFLIG